MFPAARILARTAAALAVCGLATAQSTTACDPTAGDKCPANPAIGTSVIFNFNSVTSLDSLNKFWKVDDGIKYTPKTVQFNKANGANFIIYDTNNAPTIISKQYIFFGRAEITMQAAPGQGIVTSVVLQSDDRDEIDWEFVGSHQNIAETNFYSKGVDDYTHSDKVQVDYNPMAGLHTYAVDWTPDYITFSIDGEVVRTVTPDEAEDGKLWPQTPAQLRLGTWVAGAADSPNGTAEWAGGRVNWDEAPFTAMFKSVKLVDYAGGYVGAKEYVYQGTSGLWQTIQVIGGTSKPMPTEPPEPSKKRSEEDARPAGLFRWGRYMRSV